MALRSQRRYISASALASGMMIEFSYQKKSGGGGNYVVLVVEPSRPNKYSSEPQLHGYVIDQLNDQELIEFISSFEKNIKIDRDDKRASIIEGLNSDEAYQKFLSSKYAQDRSYRTFNIKNMSQIRQILIGSVE